MNHESKLKKGTTRTSHKEEMNNKKNETRERQLWRVRCNPILAHVACPFPRVAKSWRGVCGMTDRVSMSTLVSDGPALRSILMERTHASPEISECCCCCCISVPASQLYSVAIGRSRNSTSVRSSEVYFLERLLLEEALVASALRGGLPRASLYFGTNSASCAWMFSK